MPQLIYSTVNLEIFARVLFSRNFAYGEITLSFIYKGKSCHSREFLRRKYVF